MDKPHTESPVLWDRFKAALEDQGFPVSGVVDYEPALEFYREHSNRYREWIASGKHGEMGYLQRGLDRRLDPELVFPALESVITVLKPYSPHPAGGETLRYARYLNGPDYHIEMKSAIERAFSSLREAGALPEGFDYKICVDTSAVLERTWAALTGLGWIGKNTLLIHPQLGSYVFIGVVFTNHRFGANPVLLKDYCGPCTRCLASCPTEAITPHDLDSRKCISYLTLEKRGAWDRAWDTKGFVAGCDLCQEVCPYNTKAVRHAPSGIMADHLVTDPERLLAETESEYRMRIEGTALERVKFADFRRNLAATQSGDRKE
ncbi:MAG: tRNA epoxyqueuosine(34) reductase QueG [Proteobacteria bacterium]|nr:tRNA epoxyqueuosine(34) reductase QueG [Pseudomonadota bacterium]